MNEATLFYQNDLQISQDQADSIAWFMETFGRHQAILSASPWAKSGQARIYLDLWSQNKMPAIDCAQIFYDAEDREIYIKFTFPRTETLKGLVGLGQRGLYSGAKTRARITELSEEFYGQV